MGANASNCDGTEEKRGDPGFHIVAGVIWYLGPEGEARTKNSEDITAGEVRHLPEWQQLAVLWTVIRALREAR